MTTYEKLEVAHDLGRVGTLWLDDSDRFHFQYESKWMASPEGFEISMSLPFQDDAYEEGPARFFFTNLLPEGGLRSLVCRRLGISEDNDFGLLSAIGGECAGALALLPQEDEEVLTVGANAQRSLRSRDHGRRSRCPAPLQRASLQLGAGAPA